MTATDWKAHSLAAPLGPLRLVKREEINAALSKLLTEARHHIAVFAPRLEFPAFEDPAVHEALVRFVHGRPRTGLMMLVGDDAWFMNRNSRLRELCRRYSSFVKARLWASDEPYAQELYVVADGVAYLHQPHVDKPDTAFALGAKGMAHGILRRFSEAWERGEAIAGLLTVGL